MHDIFDWISLAAMALAILLIITAVIRTVAYEPTKPAEGLT